jgi:hypothetical protein
MTHIQEKGMETYGLPVVNENCAKFEILAKKQNSH